MATEVWQRGPVAGYEPMLMPVVHSLLQVKEDIDALASSVREEQLWEQPSGAAAIGFHLLHIAGSTERLLTYARGESLTAEQVASARRESAERPSLAALTAHVHAAIDRALEQVRTTPLGSLLGERKVGRAGLPSTTIGLLFHAAEHATRHAGQAITTARILGGKVG
jgi:uncharacterized damage-inducible protein DinB